MLGVISPPIGGAANRIAKLDSTGTIDTTFNPAVGSNGTNNTVWVILTYGTDIFVGGDFTAYRGAALKYLAKLNSAGVLDSTFSTTTGPSSSIYALATNGSTIYAGGNFTTYKGAPANRVAALDYSTAALDTIFSPAVGGNGFNNKVYSLVLNGSDLYIGGAFTSYRGATVNRVIKTDLTGAANAAFIGVGTTGFNSTVNALATDGISLFAVGAFFTYRGTANLYLAKLNLTSGVLDATFITGGSIAGPSVVGNTILWTGSHLLVGGIFTSFRGQNRINILTLNSTGAPQ